LAPQTETAGFFSCVADTLDLNIQPVNST